MIFSTSFIPLLYNTFNIYQKLKLSCSFLPCSLKFISQTQSTNLENKNPNQWSQSDLNQRSPSKQIHRRCQTHYQAVIQLLEALNLFYSISKEESLDVVLAVSSISIYFISLLTGELGRKRSRVNLLKSYMVSSSIGMLLSIVCVLKSNLSLKVIQDLSGWETKKSELFWAAGLLVGLLVQILSISTTTSIISNMSPPKRAT